MCAGEVSCFQQICSGGEEESWLWQCMQTEVPEGNPGRVCAEGPCFSMWLEKVMCASWRLGLQAQGYINTESHICSCRAGQYIAKLPAGGGRDGCLCQGAALLKHWWRKYVGGYHAHATLWAERGEVKL